MAELYDFLVIGAGIAGASAAFELAPHGKTILLEKERSAGFHATGRSAAIFLETYGNETVRALTRASRAFFERPPPGFSDMPIVAPRGALFVADASSLPKLHRHYEALTQDKSTTARWVEADKLSLLCPCLKPGHWVAGIYEPDALDLDIRVLQEGFLRRYKETGGTLRVEAEVLSAQHNGTMWQVRTNNGELRARFIVNAAGAWGDIVARRAGVNPIGLSARRRTAVVIEPTQGPSGWPYTGDIAETFYFKPDAGQILASPCDETEIEACDAKPEESDVIAIRDRLLQTTTLPAHRISRRWAGLRTFTPDRTPAVGFAEGVENFFWLVGQGGYGFQTAPAMAAVCRGLIIDSRLPPELVSAGVSISTLSPARFVQERLTS